MKNLFFWKSWFPAERRAAVSILFIALSALGFLLLKIQDPVENSVRWDVLSQLSDLEVLMDTLPLGNLQFGVSVPSTTVTEWFVASGMETSAEAVGILLVFGLIGLSVTLAALTTLPRFWYFSAAALFILLLAFSRLEMLAILAGSEKGLLLATIVLYSGCGYYLHAFRPDVGIVRRSLLFLGITALLGAGVAVFSENPSPAAAFMAYSMPLWLAGSLLFLLLCATEIFYGLLWLTTSGTTGRNSNTLLQFGIVSFLYLVILVFAYVENTRIADWGIVIVSPFFLGLAAALIGLYGFRLRCESTGGILSYRQTGFWLYTGLLLVTVSFVTYAAVTSNDPLLEVMEDIVINSQLGMGLVFLYYIVANFLPLFRKRLEVHKVVYKPLNFDLSKARVFGLGVVVVLFSMQKLFPFHQAVAAYFNNLGDLHVKTREYPLAEQYYRMSLQQEFQNHKANYALASLSRLQGDENAAVFYFRQATLKKPSPQAYIGLSNVLIKENLYFDALFNLKEGVRKFPENGHLRNNLGLLFSRTSVADSAFYFLKQAESLMSDNAVPAANLLALVASTLHGPALDSATQEMPVKNSLSWEANYLAVLNLRRQFQSRPLRKDAMPADSALNASAYSYWLNYAFNQARNDSTLTSTLFGLAEKNALAGDELLLAATCNEFYTGEKSNALDKMLTMASNSDKKAPLYHKILGYWFMKLGLPEKAVTHFSMAPDAEGRLGYALAMALAGKPETGAILLEKMKETPETAALASQLQARLETLRLPPSAADSLLLAAQKKGSDAAYRKALKANPFDPEIVTAAVFWFKSRKTPPNTLLQLVVEALRFNESSPVLWENYALLCLEMGLTEQAEEGREKVKQFADPAGYTGFLTRYQPQKTLIEKARRDFQ